MPLDLDERATCELCRLVFNRATVNAVAELNDELLTACLGCLARIIMRELPGRVVHI